MYLLWFWFYDSQVKTALSFTVVKRCWFSRETALYEKIIIIIIIIIIIFLCFTQFGDSSFCLNFDKFCDPAAPLRNLFSKVRRQFCVKEVIW